jgi:hypothetical protein
MKSVVTRKTEGVRFAAERSFGRCSENLEEGERREKGGVVRCTKSENILNKFFPYRRLFQWLL